MESKDQKSGKRRPFTVWLFGLLLTALIAGGAATAYVYNQLQPVEADGSKTVTVTIPPGSSLREIGAILEKHGLIKNATVFTYYSKWKGMGNILQAGTYQFRPGQSPLELLNAMAEGKVVRNTVRITIPEGLHVEQIARLLEEKGLVDKQAFLREVKEGDFSRFAFVREIPSSPGRKYRLEGYLFPETYEVEKGATAHEIISLMLGQFEKEFRPEWREALKKRNLSVDDAVNLASIVEREVVVDKERPLVAGVFFNRLREDWLLQSCATVQFVLGKQRDRITFEDLKIQSPYNTYLHPGLPPGPIASPGRASLEAVVHPAKHDYFFFVTKKDGSKEHFFSRTLEEHLAKDAKSRGNW